MSSRVHTTLRAVSFASDHADVTTKLYGHVREPNAVSVSGMRSHAPSPLCSMTITVRGEGTRAKKSDTTSMAPSLSADRKLDFQ